MGRCKHSRGVLPVFSKQNIEYRMTYETLVQGRHWLPSLTITVIRHKKRIKKLVTSLSFIAVKYSRYFKRSNKVRKIPPACSCWERRLLFIIRRNSFVLNVWPAVNRECLSSAARLHIFFANVLEMLAEGQPLIIF